MKHDKRPPLEQVKPGFRITEKMLTALAVALVFYGGCTIIKNSRTTLAQPMVDSFAVRGERPAAGRPGHIAVVIDAINSQNLNAWPFDIFEGTMNVKESTLGSR
jgi:hypothetical protein